MCSIHDEWKEKWEEARVKVEEEQKNEKVETKNKLQEEKEKNRNSRGLVMIRFLFFNGKISP